MKLPCGGQTVLDVELNPLYWGTVSCTASRQAFSNLSFCPGIHLHHPALPLPPQGHCLHCRLLQGHTNTTIDKHREVHIFSMNKEKTSNSPNSGRWEKTHLGSVDWAGWRFLFRIINHIWHESVENSSLLENQSIRLYHQTLSLYSFRGKFVRSNTTGVPFSQTAWSQRQQLLPPSSLLD